MNFYVINFNSIHLNFQLKIATMISKKNNIASFLLSLLMVISLIGCSDDDSTGNENQNSTGDYWPAALNNQWEFSQNGVDQEPMKIISINELDSINVYFVFVIQFVQLYCIK